MWKVQHSRIQRRPKKGKSSTSKAIQRGSYFKKQPWSKKHFKGENFPRVLVANYHKVGPTIKQMQLVSFLIVMKSWSFKNSLNISYGRGALAKGYTRL